MITYPYPAPSYSSTPAALCEMGHKLSVNSIPRLLTELGFRRLGNFKNKETSDHPDRDAQFEYINAQANSFQVASMPVVSIDTKKKENVGNFKNNGSDYRPKGSPDEVNDHDFMDETLGKAIPHGIYDTTANEGWVTVGITHDTSEFAVNSLRYWWRNMGMERYPNADSLLITADGGGSNGSRVHLWKRELQTFANETGISVTVCHYPPGTSKWNKIEHRLFCQITQNWRGKPLTSLLAIVELIAATTTKTGLKVRCELDERTYVKSVKVSDEEFQRINITKHDFCPSWNYTIRPQDEKHTTKKSVIIG